MAQDRPSSAVNSCIYLPVDLNKSKRLTEEASAVSVAVWRTLLLLKGLLNLSGGMVKEFGIEDYCSFCLLDLFRLNLRRKVMV